MNDNTVVTPENTPVDTNLQPESAAPENLEDVNWKKFREERAEDRRKREEADQRARKSQEEAAALKAAMDALLNKQQPQQQESDPDFDDEETRISKRVDAAFAARERQYEEQRRQEEQKYFPTRLKQSMPDFDNVCSTENLDYLEYHHPAIAKSFGQMHDGFEKWAGIYDVVKKLVPNTDSKRDMMKAEKNLAKPQSMTRPGMGSTGDGPPQILDAARKAENYKRMQKIIKGI